MKNFLLRYEPHVFISHSSKDSKYAKRLAKHLGKSGIYYWLDETGIDHGQDFPAEIQKYLDECSVFTVVMTPAASRSTWVRRETLRAQRLEKPIFPLLLKGDPLLLVEEIPYQSVEGGEMPPSSWMKDVKRIIRPT